MTSIPPHRVLLLLLIPLLGFAGCAEKQESQDPKKSVGTPLKLSESNPINAEEKGEVNVNSLVGKRRVPHDYRGYAEENGYSAEPLIPRILQSKEVEENPGDKTWMALTVSGDGKYALSEVTPTFERVKNMIVDDEGDEPSGWEAKVVSEDFVLLLS